MKYSFLREIKNKFGITSRAFSSSEVATINRLSSIIQPNTVVADKDTIYASLKNGGIFGLVLDEGNYVTSMFMDPNIRDRKSYIETFLTESGLLGLRGFINRGNEYIRFNGRLMEYYGPEALQYFDTNVTTSMIREAGIKPDKITLIKSPLTILEYMTLYPVESSCLSLRDYTKKGNKLIKRF